MTEHSDSRWTGLAIAPHQVFLCEGLIDFLTGIEKEEQRIVLGSHGASNLPYVASEFGYRFPDAHWDIAAHNDPLGITAAEEAAYLLRRIGISARVLDLKTDLNDLHLGRSA